MGTPDSERPPHPFKTISSRTAWSCPWYSIREDVFTTPAGSEGRYYIVDVIGGVWIIPLTRKNEIVLIYNYRYPISQWCWELPAGGMRTGQTPEEVARAELKEEIGGRAQDLFLFTTFHTVPSISNEKAHVFIATGVELGQTDHEDTEVMQVHALPMDEVFEMARTNRIHDARSAYALLIAEQRLRELARA
ncbi:MAG TPA: NUDIX hydrolase [Planctomycetota bacterium]|nr:NUDIX hydrolase [Planctomycetota bacterium]